MTSTKKKRIAIVTIATTIFILIIAFIGYLYEGNLNNSNNNNNTDSRSYNSNDNRDNIAIGSSTSSQDIRDDAENENSQESQSSSNANSSSKKSSEHGDDSALSYSGMSTTGERLLNGKDQDKIKSEAESFIQNFRTFDYGTLSNGSWRTSINKYIDMNTLLSNADDSLNILYKTYGNQSWDAEAGQYKLYTNAVNAIDKSKTKLDGSQDTGYNFDCIVCYVTITERGQSTLEPNNTNFWQSINETETTYRISMVPDTLKIYRVAISNQNIINKDINEWAKQHNYAGTNTQQDNNNPFGIDLNDPAYKEMVENMKKRDGI